MTPAALTAACREHEIRFGYTMRRVAEWRAVRAAFAWLALHLGDDRLA